MRTKKRDSTTVPLIKKSNLQLSVLTAANPGFDDFAILWLERIQR